MEREAYREEQHFDEATLPFIEEEVRRLLDRMGFASVVVHCRSEASGDLTRLEVTIEAGEEGKLLIGMRGGHLAALQHVLRCVLRRRAGARVAVLLDVNGYRARRERSLSSVAEAAARRAAAGGQTVMLKPMEAADRRTVHTALAGRADVRTESVGDEPERRVVIKPVFL